MRQASILMLIVEAILVASCVTACSVGSTTISNNPASVAHGSKPAKYIVTGIGTLHGYFGSYAASINDSGLVVGTAYGSLPYGTAVVYKEGVLSSLGTLPGDSVSEAFSVNEAGDAVGFSGSLYGPGPSLRSRGVLFSHGAVTDLTAKGKCAFDNAMGINNTGQIVGYTGANAFLFADGKTTYLGRGAAFAINDSGTIVGYSAAGIAAFFQHGSEISMGTLGGNFSVAKAVNDKDQVVGSSQLAGPSDETHAFLFQRGVMRDLGVPSGGRNSEALSINKSGEVVGVFTNSKGTNLGFVYSNGVMLDLNDLIAPKLGWVLGDAYHINDRGQIVGAGLFEGQPMGYLLTPQP